MTLLVTPEELAARRSVAAGPLGALAESLAADLDALEGRELYVPSEKALLSREGGRCATDGMLLEFDPFSPHEHVCARCGRRYTGELHYRFWIYWYQLWLAERAVHGAALWALRGDARHAAVASGILQAYVERYLQYPNRDNVLGPSRLFFSTYLESIWLLQICIALDLLELGGDRSHALVRERIVEPARRLIAQYDEGLSNRQVWNNAALLAAARLLDDEPAAEDAVFGTSGLATHLADALLPDGSWYEGENYHLFAHRGLWYGVTIAERAGLDVPAPLVDRFQSGFAAPFATALPDFTLPARRDSQYGISLRQWRMVEHTELGFARADDALLAGALYRMYAADIPRRATGRAASSADVERHVGATALTRADMSWRGLLHARPALPPLSPTPQRSALLDGQGIAVFRRNAGRTYVALDYGHAGGGHGHPDRLNLLLADGATRWLDDMGTGSYVDPSLHWYRSTLAHNAPLVNGRSQLRVHGQLLAHDERETAGWIMAAAEEIAPGTSAARRIVVMEDYLIDEVEWRSDAPVKVDLPVHVDGTVVRGARDLHPDQPSGAAGLEDGFAFLRDTSMQRAAPGDTVELTAGPDAALRIWWASDRDAEWWRAVAPGPPGGGNRPFRFVRAKGESGTHRSVWSWSGAVTGVEFGDGIRVRLASGVEHTHRRTDDGWHVDVGGGVAIDLAGVVDEEPVERRFTPSSSPHLAPQELLPGTQYELELGEANYRRSEESWQEAGKPSATVTLEWTGDALRVDVDVPRADRTFVAEGAVNPYDNESPDINGDGVQLYLATRRGVSGWVLVPDAGSDRVRARPVDGWTTPRPLDARWEPREFGYRMHIDMQGLEEPSGHLIALDVVVNEKPRGRERRRGQLVLSGARDEFVYLRGDRHDPTRLIPFLLPSARG